RRKAILDSMELDLTTMARTTEFKPEKPGPEFISLRNLYSQKKQKFEEDNLRLSREYDKQIWNQLNQYIKDFGEERNYSMIFGANGQGSLMYAEDTKDITSELIDYINQKYERV
ncbi:MAG: OmpH family outer membrane protein, partial [Owenweeksia sp.]